MPTPVPGPERLEAKLQHAGAEGLATGLCESADYVMETAVSHFIRHGVQDGIAAKLHEVASELQNRANARRPGYPG
jgi:predicted transcriptional regulator